MNEWHRRLMRSKVPQMLFSGGKKSTMLQKIIEKNQKFRKNGLGMCTLITEVVVGRAQTCSCWRGESTWASTAPNRCVCIFISDKKNKNKTSIIQTTSILVVQMLRVVINSHSSGFSSLSFCCFGAEFSDLRDRVTLRFNLKLFLLFLSNNRFCY